MGIPIKPIQDSCHMSLGYVIFSAFVYREELTLKDEKNTVSTDDNGIFYVRARTIKVIFSAFVYHTKLINEQLNEFLTRVQVFGFGAFLLIYENFLK